jgi:hypothetical protein
MIITLIVFGLIMVVAYSARPKITNWRTYAAAAIGTQSAVVRSAWFGHSGNEMASVLCAAGRRACSHHARNYHAGGIDVSLIGSAEVLAATARIAAAPPELLAHLKKLIGDNKSGGSNKDMRH